MKFRNGFVPNSSSSSFLILMSKEQSETIFLGPEFSIPTNEELEDFMYNNYMDDIYFGIRDKDLQSKNSFHFLFQVVHSKWNNNRKKAKNFVEKLEKKPYIINISCNGNYEEDWRTVAELRLQGVEIIEQEGGD